MESHRSSLISGLYPLNASRIVSERFGHRSAVVTLREGCWAIWRVEKRQDIHSDGTDETPIRIRQIGPHANSFGLCLFCRVWA